jgi:murein DD-endopeptidase MepM/ murein hydrolase activator NlpD
MGRPAVAPTDDGLGVLGGPYAGFWDASVAAGRGGDGYAPASEIAMRDAALVAAAAQAAVANAGAEAQAIVRRFALPARGTNWGIMHAHNAIDIAAPCGAPVYAAYAGQVIAARTGWEGGYGNLIDIDHGAGVVTRYAHNAKNKVEVGQLVGTGDVIASVGSTGESTGCHVHFEVRAADGARNPFGVR